MLIKKKHISNINESTSKKFVIDEKGVLIKYKGKDKNVVIPDGVTKIGEHVFDCGNFKTITIPNSVKSIGDGAFTLCRRLESITIPYSVTFIGNQAFESCLSLTEVILPKKYLYFGRGVFLNCMYLKSIIIPDCVTSISGLMFKGCTFLESITIPKSVRYIDKYAFGDCTHLENVTISDSGNIQIYEFAFDNCKNLKEITIPNSVVYMSDNVFSGCENLKTINIPNPNDITPKTLNGTHITKFNGVDISDTDDLVYKTLSEGVVLVFPGEEYTHYEINREECYIRYFKSYYNRFFIVVYSDMTREVFNWYFDSLTKGIRLVEILDIYDKYPVGVREDGKQTFLGNPKYKGQWFDECYTDMKGNMYIDGEKVDM